ncbi:MAG: zinc-ribbon domain-containing protein [Syntrophobacterales bacterium]|nr:zinc-ribbon domain-containing protein [Syntrophobacterales bacterium]
MIVTCGSCGTKFKVDPSKVKKDKVKVRCSRCRHVFNVSLGPSPEEEAKKSEKVIVLDDSFEEEIEKVAGKPTTSSYQMEEQEVDDSLETHTEEVSKRDKPPTKKASPFAINKLVVIGTIVLIVVGLLIYKYFPRQPKTTPSEQTTRVEVATARINPQTQAFFIENVQVGQILVVQGEVNNSSNSNISFILLEGKIIGTNGKPLLSQRFYAGNIMTKEELAQLTIDKIQERMMRREGNNLSNVRVKPGDKVPFMVVFYNLPPIDDMSDYTIEFVSAEVEKSPIAQEGVTKGRSQ